MSVTPVLEGFNEGVFALVDVLGFKGIWENKDADAILGKLKGISAMRDDPAVRIAEKYQGMVVVKIVSLSDSVAICSHFPVGAQGLASGVLVHHVGRILQSLIARFAAEPLPLAVRGAIVYGKYRIEENHLVGPAVDEAAERHQVPQGAFVWLAPSAVNQHQFFTDWTRGPEADEMFKSILEEELGALKKIMMAKRPDGSDRAWIGEAIDACREEVRGMLAGLFNSAVYIPYPMPVKGGVLSAMVVQPFDQPAKKEENTFMAERVIATMNRDSVDVMIKRHNTESFLTHARKLANENNDSIGRVLSARLQSMARRTKP